MAYGKVKISVKYADDADYTENVVPSSFPEKTSSPTKHLFGQIEVTVAASPKTILAVNNFATVQKVGVHNPSDTYYVKLNWTSDSTSGSVSCAYVLGPGDTGIIPNMAAGAALSATAINGTVTLETFVLAT